MTNSELEDEVEGFWNYFKHEAVPMICEHQSTVVCKEKELNVEIVPLTLETFAAEVLQCIWGLHVHEMVHTYV